jgi:hypothetical protein
MKSFETTKKKRKKMHFAPLRGVQERRIRVVSLLAARQLG